jgi:hypothetical protein
MLAAAGLGWAALHARADLRLAAGAGALVMVVVARLVRPAPDPQRWLRGAAGEVATATLLERLPAGEWAVLHDLAVPASRANIDHLAIGPNGVWVIDTKATRGRARRGVTGLWLGSRRLDTGPVRFEAQVVADRLGLPARAVVAVHGDTGLRRRGVRCRGVRVVAAGRLPHLLRRTRWWAAGGRLHPAEVERLARLALAQFAPAGCRGRNGGGSGRSIVRANRRGG